MKKSTTLVIVIGSALALANARMARGQGFSNLDFESAMIVSAGTGFAEFGPAFSGWSAYYGPSSLSPVTPITYNNRRFGTPGLGLLNTGGSVISNFTALLQGGTGNNDFSVSLAQVGQVPSGALSLQFMAHTIRPGQFGTGETFTVSMNGQELSYFRLQSIGNFRLYGVDVSAFAGQTAELRFTQRSGGAFFDDLGLDNISFSPVAVPEPSTWALLALGSALFWCAARRRRK